MALPNPAINPPRLPSPTKRGLHSRSPSRSPTRQHPRDFDPLLRDLSPSSTLRAFSLRPDERQNDALARSIESASPGERALGAKAAQAASDLRAWAREVEAWGWPGTFAMLRTHMHSRTMSGLSLFSRADTIDTMQQSVESVDEEEEYWGSLPAQMVEEYEERLDQISLELDEMDVEQLKNFVLSAHSRAPVGETSIDDSLGTIGAATDLKRLDDFTALITATILHALPYLSRLTRLLNVWSVRLSILRSTPKFLRDLAQARRDLDHGWAALAISSHPKSNAHLASASFTRDIMEDMKVLVSKQVYSLGKRLDSFLDLLEGREEVVPDEWINDFEELERQYGAWVVQAERKVIEGEWKHTEQERDAEAKERDEAEQRDEAAADAPIPLPAEPEAALRDPTTFFSPIMSTTTTTTTRDMSGNRPMTTTNVSSSGPRSMTTTTITPHDGPASPSRARYVPIVVNYNEPDKIFTPPDATPLPEDPTPSEPSQPLQRSVTPNSEGATNVKKRAAFFNNDIENALIRSKPAPIVRPFEHASNAFTRLFKRDAHSEAQQVPISRTASGGSLKRIDPRTAVTNPGQASLATQDPASDNDGRKKSLERPKSGKDDKHSRLEYIDMARAPEFRTSEEKRQSSRPTTPTAKKDSRRLAYGDLVMASIPSRRSKDGRKSSRPTTPKDKVASLPQQPPFDLQKGSQPKSKAIETETDNSRTLSSPFKSPKGKAPDDWPLPLSADATPTAKRSLEVEPQTVKRGASRALDSDHFESTFVNSFSSTPEQTLRRPVTANVASTADAGRSVSSKFSDNIDDSASRPKTAPTYDELWSVRPPANKSILRNGVEDKSLRLDWPDSTPPRPVSTVEEAEYESSTATATPYDDGDDFDNAAAYFGGTPSSTRGVVVATAIRQASSKSTPPVSPRWLKMKASEAEAGEADDERVIDSNGNVMIIRRASTASTEWHPRSELKVVDIQRRSSTGSNGFGASSRDPRRSSTGSPGAVDGYNAPQPETPRTRQSELADNITNSPLAYKGMVVFPSPPNVPPRGSSLKPSSGSARNSMESSTPIQPPSSPPAEQDAPLNAVVSKQRQAKRPSRTPAGERPTSPPDLQPGADNFDRHVSEVLHRVHAPIRFRTGPRAETPVPGGGPKSKLKGKSSAKNLTLAPAEPSPKKSTAAEPEVKLYHLTQAGRSEPIKLFVRLVGEGERVMVRVGGGWADLADYLRQYAEHHGSRTVSESVLELQTATAGSGGSGKRAFSGPAEPKSIRGTPLTPTSSSEQSWLSENQPRFSMGDSDDETTSPIVSNSRPGSSPSIASSPPPAAFSSETSSPTGLGMAGPGANSAQKGKAELPEQKARWVEGMIERAKKSASAEKDREAKEKYFSELGRVGGTKRVVFKEAAK